MQLQLSDNQDFMLQVLDGSQPNPAQWQVLSDTSYGGELDCSDLINSCDNDAND